MIINRAHQFWGWVACTCTCCITSPSIPEKKPTGKTMLYKKVGAKLYTTAFLK